jgi:hypothetical protein
MTTRHAACNCGQLRLTIEGEPSRISMCHCLECQRRTGAVISNQARFRRASPSLTHTEVEPAMWWSQIRGPFVARGEELSSPSERQQNSRGLRA